jgi:hypothetical protein
MPQAPAPTGNNSQPSIHIRPTANNRIRSMVMLCDGMALIYGQPNSPLLALVDVSRVAK